MGARFRQLRARLRAGALREAIPLADAGSFARSARRTQVLRFVLAAALLGVVVAAFASGTNAQGRRFFPSSRVGIVVLDISSSITPSTYDLIKGELTALAATNQRFGVVLFSDDAYEALPPGTPARELRPFIRFFDRHRPFQYDQLGVPRPRSPWEQSFSGGTSISSGLLLAADLLQQKHVTRGDVVLISDLVDDPSDFNHVADALALYSERSIPLTVVALNPPPENRDAFEALLGKNGVISNAVLPHGKVGRGLFTVSANFPIGLAVFGCLAILLLAIEALWAEPLRWRPVAE
jgi:hypothetical protein